MSVLHRRTILFTMLVGLAFSGAAWAQSDPVFAHLDSNHDGRISLSEHGAAEKALFSRVDANQDGKLTGQEIASMRQAMTQVEIAAEDRDAAALAQAVTHPGSKVATPAVEDVAVAQALFDRLDTNHDGTVSSAEMQAAHNRPPPAQTRPVASGLGMAAVLDGNHDGFVSASEHAAIALARFARMDVNRDGYVSSQEWTAAHSKTAKAP